MSDQDYQPGDLYHQVVSITEEYLGPAAPRFVTRQVSFHLNKTPEELSIEDLPKFVEWAHVTFSLLTDDRETVNRYVAEIGQLATKPWPGAAQRNL